VLAGSVLIASGRTPEDWIGTRHRPAPGPRRRRRDNAPGLHQALRRPSIRSATAGPTRALGVRVWCGDDHRGGLVLRGEDHLGESVRVGGCDFIGAAQDLRGADARITVLDDQLARRLAFRACGLGVFLPRSDVVSRCHVHLLV
jgi:hypothetical protein